MPEKCVEEAFSRVSATKIDENQEFIDGTLRGFLLDSGKFEIQNKEGRTITGFISPELSEDDVIQFDQTYLNKNCRIHLQIHTTIFKTGRSSSHYELLGIDSNLQS